MESCLLALIYNKLPDPCQKKVKEYLAWHADIIIDDYEREAKMTKLGEYFLDWSDGLDDTNQTIAELTMDYSIIYSKQRELYLLFEVSELYIGHNNSDLYIRGTHIENNKYYFKINLKDASFYSRDLFIYINKEDLGDDEKVLQTELEINDENGFCIDFNSWIHEMDKHVRDLLKNTFRKIVIVGQD
jgi:hypothetical protein